MEKKKLIFLILTLTTLNGFGQIREKGIPKSFESANLQEAKVYSHFASMLKSTSIDTIRDDMDIGKTIPINLDIKKDGTWSKLKDGTTICRYNITSNEGYYMMLIFDKFHLPRGSKLFVYTEDRQEIIGAFTEKNNKKYNKFSTAPIKGNSIIIEYNQPSNFISDSLELRIASLGIVEIDLSKRLKELGESGDCMVNAMCPDYSGWCDQRRSVAMIIRVTSSGGRMRWCTGSLLTNEKRDGRPYFLTAFHCLDNEDDGGEDGNIDNDEKLEVNNWVFVFNYQSPNCENPTIDPSTAMSISGATFLSARKKTDFVLLELSNRPAPDFNTYYNGWSNDDDDMSGTGVSIHHPSGDIKKISAWDKKTSLLPNYWRVDYTDGSTEGGSSGCPLFNSSGYVVGQLKMGLAACDNSKSDYYGKFHKSWDKGDNSSERLRDWLSPNSSGSFYISSMNGDETCKENWYFSNGDDLHTSANIDGLNNMIEAGSRMYDGVYNATNNITAENNVTIKDGTSVTFEAGNSITLGPGFKVEKGASFTARISNCERGCGNGFKSAKVISDNNEYITILSTDKTVEDSINIHEEYQSQEYIKVNGDIADELNISLYPNPTNGIFTVQINNISDIKAVKLYNINGQLVYFQNTININEINLDISQLKSGVYFVRVLTVENKVVIKKLIYE